MQARNDFQKAHVHKEAGMKETIVMGCLPMDAPNAQKFPYPIGRGGTSAFGEDGPIVVLHVIKFKDNAPFGETPETNGLNIRPRLVISLFNMVFKFLVGSV